MFITIHCGGMPFDGDTINEHSLGGSESAAYYMAKELAALGHKVSLFTRTDKQAIFDGVRYVPIGQQTEACPLGEDFHHYAANTKSDVLIIQRHPAAFRFPWASKINLLWLHDLVSLSTKPIIDSQLANIDGVLTVSEWHREQAIDTWGLNPDIVMAIHNGVDLDLYEARHALYPAPSEEIPRGFTLWETEEDYPELAGQMKLLYSSRPERGLENLVMPRGIMERLAVDKPEAHLYVCNYNNTTQRMAGYYAYLYNRCNELPNVTLLGHLTKQQLADVQRQCDLCIYPTSFEETSCITAMECMAAGLPLLSSSVGALPETCEGSGAILLPTAQNDENYRGMELRVEGKADVDSFVERVISLANNRRDLVDLKDLQLDSRRKFVWANAVAELFGHINTIFEESRSVTGYMKECLRNSDIYALDYFMNTNPPIPSAIERAVKKELDECYHFAFHNQWAEHYAAYYEYEKNRGVNYGPENLDSNGRFEFVSDLLSVVPAGGRVLDYGCAHGHYTINLAKRFPGISFIGVDITASNVEKARKWAADEGITNVEFKQGAVNGALLEIQGEDEKSVALESLDLIIAAEVLEHLESPAECADALSRYLKPEGTMLLTVPYGSWESQGYAEHWPWRAHVHHLDRQDLHELFGMHQNFDVVSIPAGRDAYGDALGSYAAMYTKPTEPSGQVDYDRKYQQSKGRQTLSLCMIVRDAQETIERALLSTFDIVDEVVIGLDEKTEDATADRISAICEKNHVPYTFIRIKSPTEIGFDAARNITVDNAVCDWILWLDADEILDNAKGLARHLRNNQFNGYAIAQHHFSMHPAGIMKTDLPVRIFRNGKGIKFYGVVHEHPELEINKSVGWVTTLPEVSIGHYGYTNENIRRGRFQRNIELLMRDLEQNPERKLTKFLWLRDLSQMCGFEAEINGMQVSDAMIKRAKRGVQIFEELLASKDTLRMAVDGLDFYSNLVRVLGVGFDFSISIGEHDVQGHFYKKEHLRKLIALIIDEKVVDNGQTKYL